MQRRSQPLRRTGDQRLSSPPHQDSLCSLTNGFPDSGSAATNGRPLHARQRWEVAPLSGAGLVLPRPSQKVGCRLADARGLALLRHHQKECIGHLPATIEWPGRELHYRHAEFQSRRCQVEARYFPRRCVHSDRPCPFVDPQKSSASSTLKRRVAWYLSHWRPPVTPSRRYPCTRARLTLPLPSVAEQTRHHDRVTLNALECTPCAQTATRCPQAVSVYSSPCSRTRVAT